MEMEMEIDPAPPLINGSEGTTGNSCFGRVSDDAIKVGCRNQVLLNPNKEQEQLNNSRNDSASSLILVGFYYNVDFGNVDFFPVTAPKNSALPPPPPYYFGENIGKRYTLVTTRYGNGALAILNTSNGLALLYSSSFSKKYSCFIISNPFTSDATNVGPPPDSISSCNVDLKFLVFGFAFEPDAPEPKYTILQVSDVLVPNKLTGVEEPNLMVYRYCNLTHPKWVCEYHRNTSDCVLSGPSVFHEGNLHWLLEPSGVIAYRVRNGEFCYSLGSIPEDTMYVDESGLCYCSRRRGCHREIGGPTSAGKGGGRCICTCRFLAESRGNLTYIRITGDSELLLWTLVDYSGGVWSSSRRIIVEKLPYQVSLLYGKVVEFQVGGDNGNTEILFLRVGTSIFMYNCCNKQLTRMYALGKRYEADGNNCDGFVVPLKGPRIHPPCLPKKASGSSDTCIKLPEQVNKRPHELALCSSDAASESSRKRRQNGKATLEAPLTCLNQASAGPAEVQETRMCPPKQSSHHFAVSYLAEKFIPRIVPPQFDASKTPVRSWIVLPSPNTMDGFDKLVCQRHYGDLLRLEACLYGSVTGCSHQDKDTYSHLSVMKNLSKLNL